MTRSALLAALALAIVPLAQIASQPAPRLVRVEGLAYDSLAKVPLRGALIAVQGTSRSAMSDDKGRFRIDSVPEGTHLVAMTHAAFDSIGLSGTTARVAIAEKAPRLVLTVPSFATIWRAVCGDTPVPKDSALVFGAVRSAANGSAAPTSAVEISWVDLVGGGKTLASLGQRRWRRNVTADERGEFALCGIPLNVALSMRAVGADSASGTFELAPSLSRVRRTEMLVASAVVQAAVSAGAPTDRADTAARSATPAPAIGPVGIVTGVITNEGGVPIAMAAVQVDSLPEVRTTEDGRFSFANVPAGNRQLRVVAIGRKPYERTVNLLAGDTSNVVVPLAAVTTLEAVKVNATVISMRIRTYEEHKVMGFGAFRDSTEIKKYPFMSAVIRTVPSAYIKDRNFSTLTLNQGACRADLEQIDFRLDGHRTTPDVLTVLDPQSVAAIEVFSRMSQVPTDVMSKRGPGGYKCAMLVWTQRGFGR